MKGIIIKSVGNLYSIKSKNKIYKCVYRGKNKLTNNFSNPIVSGDEVEFSLNDDKNGVIENILERKNFFIKKSLKDDKAHIIGSNIDQVLIIASIKNPYTKLGFIDKCIAASFFYNITPILVFNKIDTLNDKEVKKLKEILSIYKKIEISTLYISAGNGNNVDKLERKLKNKRTLLLGNSGVGKSTLINRISKDSNQKTNILSTKTRRGKQTTTFSEIFELKISGLLTDTPGFKDFYFFNIEKADLHFLYPEFNLRERCKFKNCLHNNEPECAIKENLGKSINIKRYNNYISILSELI